MSWTTYRKEDIDEMWKGVDNRLTALEEKSKIDHDDWFVAIRNLKERCAKLEEAVKADDQRICYILQRLKEWPFHPHDLKPHCPTCKDTGMTHPCGTVYPQPCPDCAKPLKDGDRFPPGCTCGQFDSIKGAGFMTCPIHAPKTSCSHEFDSISKGLSERWCNKCKNYIAACLGCGQAECRCVHNIKWPKSDPQPERTLAQKLCDYLYSPKQQRSAIYNGKELAQIAEEHYRPIIDANIAGYYKVGKEDGKQEATEELRKKFEETVLGYGGPLGSVFDKLRSKLFNG